MCLLQELFSTDLSFIRVDWWWIRFCLSIHVSPELLSHRLYRQCDHVQNI